MKKRILVTLLVASMVALMAGSVFAQNIVVNPGFENPALPASPADNPPEWTSNSIAASTNSDWWVFQSIPGWISDSGAGIEIQRGNVGGSGPHNGNQKVELDSDPSRGGLSGVSTNSSMYQDLTTNTGSQYELRFWYRPRTGTAGDNTINVYWDGNLVATANDNDPGNGWREIVVTGLPATSVSTELRFTAAGTENSLGGYLDDISVVALNTPPVAICQETIAAVGEEPDIDGGSYDPDGDAITFAVNPPYYTVPGIYYPTLTVTDEYGASDDCTAMVVVYDPSAGFVTGGGWIDSPAGAYGADPELTGKASFGFVSKYKKGATVPTGNTEFQFKAGDLNFHSSSYEWLVVTGSDYAMFKGTGTINGAGDYKFRIWAGDSDPDTFRIKIWEEDASGVETVIYDNGSDQAIGGGSIVIHAK
jgi:hypothetical protein